MTIAMYDFYDAETSGDIYNIADEAPCFSAGETMNINRNLHHLSGRRSDDSYTFKHRLRKYRLISGDQIAGIHDVSPSALVAGEEISFKTELSSVSLWPLAFFPL